MDDELQRKLLIAEILAFANQLSRVSLDEELIVREEVEALSLDDLKKVKGGLRDAVRSLGGGR